MNRQRTVPELARRQHGLSLVEIMVAITISLLLLAGVIQIYLGSKVSYRMQEGLSRLQENGRFAVAFLTRDLRMTGFQGCAKLSSEGGVIPSNIVQNPPPDATFDVEDPVEPVSNNGTYDGKTLAANSDIIRIRGASPSAPSLTGNLSADNANIQINSNPDNIQAGDILFITDCETADIFMASGVSESNGKVTIAHAESTNTTPKLSKAYTKDAMLLRFNAHSYFVANTGRVNDNGDAIFALYRRNDISGTSEELVEGVEDMRITYGIDNDLDGTVDQYKEDPAGAEVEKIAAVRLALLVSSVDNAATEPVPYTNLDGAQVANVNDRKLRRTFVATVGLRNRLP